jgi:hypothetical protein
LSIGARFVAMEKRTKSARKTLVDPYQVQPLFLSFIDGILT